MARVLIVEDEMTIAMMLEDMLSELGHEPVAVVSRLRQAVDYARTGDFDMALLDVNLDGHASFPVADILRERGLPFLFATGYGSGGITSEFKDVTVLRKPFLLGDLQQALGSVAA